MSELKSISGRQQCENSHHLSARADGRTTMGERKQKGGKGDGEHEVRAETLPRYTAYGGGEEGMKPSQCDISSHKHRTLA